MTSLLNPRRKENINNEDNRAYALFLPDISLSSGLGVILLAAPSQTKFRLRLALVFLGRIYLDSVGYTAFVTITAAGPRLILTELPRISKL